MLKIGKRFGLFMLCMSVLVCPALAVSSGELIPDINPPTMEFSVNGDVLSVTVEDDHSGVSTIYVGEEYFSGAKGTTLQVPLKAYGNTEYLFIFAVDYAGNKTDSHVISNPYFTGQAGTIISTITASAVESRGQSITQSGEADVRDGLDTAGTYGLKIYPVSVETEPGSVTYYYSITPNQPAENISYENVLQEGIEYVYSDTSYLNTHIVKTQDVVEVKELVSETNTLEEVIAQLEKSIPYNKNGYTGTLTLDVDSVQMVNGDVKNSSYWVYQTREYPGQTNQDFSLIPKTITYGGKTYSIASPDSVSWVTTGSDSVDYNSVGSMYTAVVKYRASASSSTVTNWNVTASYKGEVTTVETGSTIYAVRFVEGTPENLEMLAARIAEGSGYTSPDGTSMVEVPRVVSAQEKPSIWGNNVILITCIVVGALILSTIVWLVIPMVKPDLFKKSDKKSKGD